MPKYSACLFGPLLTLAIALTAASAALAEPALHLGAPFADNAVLQRGMTIPVWGWALPGSGVTVQFAGQSVSATAGDDGKWTVELDPLEASFQPREMTITVGGGVPTVLKNLLVGEVWLASGQSNMQWKAAKSSSNQLEIEPVGDAKVAPIREFEVTSVFAQLHPIEKANGAWKDGNYSDYSAIALAFAHKLHKELNVPIGILNCSFSQTAIQAWVPREGFRDAKDDYTRAIYAKVLQTDPTTPEHYAAWGAFYAGVEARLADNAGRMANGLTPRAISTKTPGNMQGNRDASWLYNGRLHPVVPYAIRGAIWNQGYANMGEGLPYYHNLHSLVRGWRLAWDRPELPVYFHQFYCPGRKGQASDQWENKPSIGSTAEMRLGTWRARDIPHTGMASQIDITGSIHYYNKAVPGQRLALHALKNDYGKPVVADGPMFRSYEVEGDKLVVQFDHAEGGLVVGETGFNANRRNEGATGFADPRPVPGGAAEVKLFHLADENRVWHPATAVIDGERVVLTAPGVKNPRGVAYGTGGVGFQPNLYNEAWLPATPFIYYEGEPVTSDTWPEESLRVAGETPAPDGAGLLYEWRKMPLLSTQFRDRAVLQAGQPITFWGSVMHDWGQEAEGEAVVKFSFAGVEKTIPVVEGSPHIFDLAPGQSRQPYGKEWRVTLPPMPPSAEPKTLKVSFYLDGQLAHERVCKDIVIGDVWYVAAPPQRFNLSKVEATNANVRVLTRKAKRSTNRTPSRYTIAVSRTPLNRFASTWDDADTRSLPGAVAHRLAAGVDYPVGVVFMQSVAPKGAAGVNLKSWIAADFLKDAPSLEADYKDLAAVVPGNPYYDANARRYIAAWKEYWSDYIPQMIRTDAVPDDAAWGSYPTLASSVTSDASQTYNVLVHSFAPGRFKGVIFLAGPGMVAEDEGANFGEQLTALANCWKYKFDGKETPFLYTLPSKELAPKITPPTGIRGPSTAVEVADWSDLQSVLDAATK